MPIKLRRIKIWKVDLCGQGANPDADILLFKSKDRQPESEIDARLPESKSILKEDTSVPKPNKIDLAKSTPEQISAYALELEKSLESSEQELEKAKKAPPAKGKKPAPGTDDGDEDDSPFAKSAEGVEMAKSIDLMKSQITTLQEELKVAKSTATTAQVEVKKAQDAAELISIEKQVEKEMPKIPGTTTEIAKMLQQAKATLTAESYTVLEKALKAGSEAIAKATAEVGSAGARAVGSAEEEIFKMADDAVKAGTYKTRPEAVAEITKSNPELAEKYKLEKSTRR